MKEISVKEKINERATVNSFQTIVRSSRHRIENHQIFKI
jgi:hypothetical protein